MPRVHSFQQRAMMHDGGNAMRRYLIALCLVAGQGIAETKACDGVPVTVSGAEPGFAARICAAAGAAIAHFDNCALGMPPPVTITTTDTLDQGCIGLFHCGENRIEIPTPEALDAARPYLTLFGHLPTERLVESVVLHELAHALYEDTPCPYEICIASSEYFAYSLQLSALTEAERAPVAARIAEMGPISRDSVNPVMLFMAPDRFVATVWAHFEARPDACEMWRGLLDGLILFDRPHP
jgi:hypothetical protein